MCLCLSSYLILILFFFLGILTVIVAQPSYSVNYGQTIQLVCTVSGNPSAQNIYWQKTKNGVQTNINSNSNSIKYQGSTTSTPSLTILNADSNDDASYTCFATNSIGTGQSQQTQLSVVGSKFTSLKYNMFF